MIKRAALIHFEDHVSTEEAQAALESIANVLKTPFDYDWEAKELKATSVGNYLEEYDDEYGGPVWYIP